MTSGWKLTPARLHWGRCWIAHREEYMQDNTHQMGLGFYTGLLTAQRSFLDKGSHCHVYCETVYSSLNHLCWLCPEINEQWFNLKLEFSISDDQSGDSLGWWWLVHASLARCPISQAGVVSIHHLILAGRKCVMLHSQINNLMTQNFHVAINVTWFYRLLGKNMT